MDIKPKPVNPGRRLSLREHMILKAATTPDSVQTTGRLVQTAGVKCRCITCGVEIPPGRSGRMCKPCRARIASINSATSEE